MSVIISVLAVSSSMALNFDNIESGVDTFFELTTAMDYQSAVVACADAGGVIASMHSDEDYEALKAKCVALCAGASDPCGCWVGIQDKNKDGVWTNADNTYQDYLIADGTATAVSPWAPNEPNLSGSEDCGFIFKGVAYGIADVPCTNSEWSSNYPLCRVISGDARKCVYGFDNNAQSGECTEPMECWGGNDNHLVSGPNNDIAGCGMAGCQKDIDTVAECSQLCRQTDGCAAYQWTSYSGDDNHQGSKVCALYESATPTGYWSANLVFCTPCDKAAAKGAVEWIDELQLDDPKDPKMWIKWIGFNAAVSAVVSLMVMALVCVLCGCKTRKSGVVYEMVDQDLEEQDK